MANHIKFSFFIFLVAFSSLFALEDYILRPGDVIAIKVIEQPEYSQKAKIRPDGKINYPIIGEIEIAGLSAAQLQKLMEEKLAPFINNVQVSVGIEQYFANKIFILGDVRAPGEYQIFEPIDVLKALALSGGSRRSKITTVKIIRANGDVKDISISAIWAGGKKSAKQQQEYLLFPGDALFVPESFTIPWAKINTILGTITVSLSLLLFFGLISPRG